MNTLPEYGIISAVDAEALARNLAAVARAFPGQTLRIAEIGVCRGDSSRGMQRFLDAHGIAFEYWGVDNGRDEAAGAACATVPPFAGAHMVIGDSAEAYIHVPDGLHFVFIDGQHCLDHVMLDVLNFGDKLVVGGRFAIHDAAPRSQKKCDNQGHGPVDHPDFGTATLEGLRKLGLLTPSGVECRRDWKLIEHTYDPTLDSAGVAVFERLAAF